MAAASPSALASSVEKTNGAKLSRLLIDGGTMVLRTIFDRYYPPANLVADLNANYHTLNNLLRRRVLHKPQWDLLFPPGGSTPDSNTFDITLLFLLLTNICGLSSPPSGWHTKPAVSDTSVEANLARIKFFRNELYGHVTTTGIDTPTFSALWLEISAVLVALGLTQAEINRLKAEHCGEEDFTDVLFEWAESEEDIKSQLKDIRQYQRKVQQAVDEVRLTQLKDRIRQHGRRKLGKVRVVKTKTQQTVDEVRQNQLEDRGTIQDSYAKLQEIFQMDRKTHQVVANVRETQTDDSEAIQEIRHTQQEFHKTLQETKSRVEEIQQTHEKLLGTQDERFACLRQDLKQTAEDLEGQKENHRENEILKKLAKIDTCTLKNVRQHRDRYVEGTRLSIFAEVESWLNDRSSPNRVMVISGNAGMGKSVISAVMCEKMQEAGRLAGCYFCQHDRARHRNPKVMLQFLASQLCDFLPDYKKTLVEKLSRNLGVEINNMEVRDLFEVLLEEPLTSLNDLGFTYLMVIDGLDESEFQGRIELLDVIANYFQGLPQWIRFLVTTRPEINIVKNLKNLHPLRMDANVKENVKDIYLCFEKQISHLLQSEHREIILRALVQKSEGVMLYAQYLVDFIKKEVPVLTPEMLDSILPTGISSVYHSYFKRLETELCRELNIMEDSFFTFLSAVAASREPLPLGFVSKLLLPVKSTLVAQRKLNAAISCVSLLLPVQDECIHFFHKSVKDWLIAKSNYGQHHFSVDEKEGHEVLSKLCTDELDDVKRKGVTCAKFSDTTKYALRHGVQHMLQLENAGVCSLEEVVKKFVLDVELLHAKLCLNVTLALEDVICVQKQLDIEKCHEVLTTLLVLLRKHIATLEKFPHTIFQTLLNEGGPELSTEALNLLETKYSEITYMKYLQKEDFQGHVQTKFHCSPLLADDDLIKLTKKFEGEHKECVRVLPYRKECDRVEVCLYVYSGKSGILEDLKEAAEEVFTHKQVAVRCLDLYNKGSRVLKVKNLEYPSGKPGRLRGDQVDKISDIISKNLHVFSNYRNVTAIQPSLKITESKQTTESCITVYVLGKGDIPIGECEIPQSVGGYRVDVVDGFWYQTDRKPWGSREPNDAQKSFTNLRLGASIGVKGERALGTLGAIVEDENNRGKLYLLTCNHVVNGGKQPNIIHPALNDYLNVVLWNLWFYMQRLKKAAPGPRTGEIDDLLAVLDDLDARDDLHDLDEFETQIRSMFNMVIEIETQHTELIMDNTTNPDEIVGFTGEKYKQPFRYYFSEDNEARAKRVSALLNTKLPELDKYKYDFLHCLENPPRDVATFIKGIKSNVQLYDKKYYVDAAVAELNPDEVDTLRDIGTVELVGTEYSPNGNCTTTDDLKKAQELCKSGRTTGFTATQDLLRKWDDAPVYLRDNRIFRVSDDSLHDSLKLDQIQSRMNEPEEPFSQPCQRSERDEHYDPGEEWHYNCLCIPSEIYPPFSYYGDSGAVIFEKCDEGSVEPKCLSGFGVLFGVFETGYKSFALASPLEVVLKKLSQEVSVNCNLKLVSDFCE